MKILGIESSCDETALALVEDGRKVLSTNLTSQDVHTLYGGVIPEIAAREHLRMIHPLYKKTLADADMSPEDIDAIAVTQGPGLIGALLVGVSFAKGLATTLRKPLIPVNHVHAHVHGALLGIPENIRREELFPSLALVVSGGHTHLYFMNTPMQFQLLASSQDDACGECFDKVAKLLGLGYPGGAAIEALAREGDETKVVMPKMMDEKEQMAFSYSGLKTHVLYLIQKEQLPIPSQRRKDICAAFQKEAIGQIVRKLQTAHSLHPNVRSIIVSGGVAANHYFRQAVKEACPIPSYFPDQKYCSDNAAMIATYAWFRYRNSTSEQFHNLDWDAFAKYQHAAQ
ncbi:MAG: tRNA (adenosine(37)-N6)-threonylcarbamoyltransferase complex transferase subunit TsaD [Deltaproteobacteria bacterium]|nr:tRNA (adenosine(37)-N6)-threonylcarbamoyltransferase complex transferase subunit TsaD [Deltaproteobacteria bacterium]